MFRHQRKGVFTFSYHLGWHHRYCRISWMLVFKSLNGSYVQGGRASPTKGLDRKKSKGPPPPGKFWNSQKERFSRIHLNKYSWNTDWGNVEFIFSLISLYLYFHFSENLTRVVINYWKVIRKLQKKLLGKITTCHKNGNSHKYEDFQRQTNTL